MFRNACYKLSLEDKDWNGAERACNQVGAHLTSVHSQEEADFIRCLQDPASVHTTWIGGKRNGFFNGLTVPLLNSNIGKQMNQTIMAAMKIASRSYLTRETSGTKGGTTSHASQQENSFVRSHQLEVRKKDI